MFDLLRNLTKTEKEKRQETLSAYLDNALTPKEKQVFEEQIKADNALRDSLEQQRLVKQNISRLPRQRAPRNFTLDPAAYGRPAPQPAFQLYPLMRAATVLSAVLLIFLFSLELFSPTGQSIETLAGVSDTATNPTLNDSSAQQESAAEESAAAPEVFNESAGEAAAGVEEAAEAELMEEEVSEEESQEETADEAEPGIVGGDGTTADTVSPESTMTDRAMPTMIPSREPDSATSLYSDTLTFPSAEPTPAPDAEVDPPDISSGALLRIGMGVLFLVLLAVTLLLRRQL